MNLSELIFELYKINVIKLGEFTLKSGQKSKIYIDLREIVSYPKILSAIAELMWQKVKSLNPPVICGVPYTALPIATAISISHDVPMLMQRKEVKDYGTKKRIEGKINTGENCLIIEDVVTTGGSVVTTKGYLQEIDLKVTDVIVVVNREQGALEHLKEQGLHLHYLTTLTEILQILKDDHRVEV
jgi:orotate phosphoribosyltransferase